MNVKTKKFTFKDIEYEIRAAAMDTEWRVKVYQGNKQAHPISYGVKFETVADARHYDFDLVDGLIDLAQSDIENGIVKLSE